MFHLDPNGLTYFILVITMPVLSSLWFIFYFTLLIKWIKYEINESPYFKYEMWSFEKQFKAFEPTHLWLFSALIVAIFNTWFYGFAIYQNDYFYHWIMTIMLIVSWFSVIYVLDDYFIALLFLIARCNGIWIYQLKQMVKYSDNFVFWIKNKQCFEDLKKLNKLSKQIKADSIFIEEDKTVHCQFITRYYYEQNGKYNWQEVQITIGSQAFNDEFAFEKIFLPIIEYNTHNVIHLNNQQRLLINKVIVNQDQVELSFTVKHFPEIVYQIDHYELSIPKLIEKIDLFFKWWKEQYYENQRYLFYHDHKFVSIDDDQVKYSQCLIASNYQQILWRYKTSEWDDEWNSFDLQTLLV